MKAIKEDKPNRNTNIAQEQREISINMREERKRFTNSCTPKYRKKSILIKDQWQNNAKVHHSIKGIEPKTGKRSVEVEKNNPKKQQCTKEGNYTRKTVRYTETKRYTKSVPKHRKKDRY